MTSFVCNICGAQNEVEVFRTEPPSCACGSNVRVRALIHLLSMDLFGQSLILAEFPKLKAIRGLGMSDHQGYARLLAEKFDYTNTYYDREPRFDFTEPHVQLSGSYDFILAADVIEHIAPPIERALEEVCRLLKPHGFFGLTIYCNPEDRMREHFPELHQFRIAQLGDSQVLINRRRDGALEIRDDLVFHGGAGATLEMREFGISALKAKLLAAGFLDVHFLIENLPQIGVLFDHDVSQPLIARKEPFVMDKCARSQMIDEWRAAEQRAHQERTCILELERRAEALAQQMRMASSSTWLRLGRRFGLGPKFVIPD
jgi:SAM-dependent methyltransferase